VVGVPGKEVASGGQRIPSQQMDVTTLPDPLVEKILEVQEELRRFKDKVKQNENATGVRQLSQPNDILHEIVAHKRDEVAAVKSALPLDQLRAKPTECKNRRSFYNALRQPGRLALIAEIKKASPSGGLLRDDFDPLTIAKIYEGAQASALSVLTNQKYFQGSLEHLTQARKATKLPILRKEFIVDEYQIIEAERHGADAVLLIVACLDLSQLRDFREAAEGEGLDALVEVHDEQELAVAMKSGARIIGINNRNLRTLKTDLDTTFRVAKELPRATRDGLILVSESGITKVDDTRRLLDAGIDAVLIGETFMRAQNIGEKVREVMGVMDFSI